MTEFVASNGWKLAVKESGDLVSLDIYSGSGGQTVNLYRSQLDALREFFQAARDSELGRWRSKEHPEYVVYPKINGSVRVVEEFTGQSAVFSRLDAFTVMYGGIAEEYFAAHSEPKPWHDAKPGEVWVIDTQTQEGLTVFSVYGAKDAPARFITSDGTEHLNSHVLAGRKIWPEVSHN
jgi:hypothetical protein